MKRSIGILALVVSVGCAETPQTSERTQPKESRKNLLAGDEIIYYGKFQGRSEDLLADRERGTQWEYKFRKFDDDPKADLEKAFNELGREGWELVTILEHGPVDQFGTQPRFIVFKRASKK